VVHYAVLALLIHPSSSHNIANRQLGVLCLLQICLCLCMISNMLVARSLLFVKMISTVGCDSTRRIKQLEDLHS
jgi:hypothetical protein